MKPSERLVYVKEKSQYAFIKATHVLKEVPALPRLICCCFCNIHFYGEMRKVGLKHSNKKVATNTTGEVSVLPGQQVDKFGKYITDLTHCPVCCGPLTDEVNYGRWNYEDATINHAQGKPKVQLMHEALFGN